MSSGHDESQRRSASPLPGNLSDAERQSVPRGPRYDVLKLEVNKIAHYASDHAFDGNKWIAFHLRQHLQAIYERVKNIRMDYWAFYRGNGPDTDPRLSYAQLVVNKLAELVGSVAKDVHNTRPRTVVQDAPGAETGMCSRFTIDVVSTTISLALSLSRICRLTLTSFSN